MILVPKERAWSKLHDDDKNFYNFFVLLPKMKERKSVLELRANPVHRAKLRPYLESAALN